MAGLDGSASPRVLPPGQRPEHHPLRWPPAVLPNNGPRKLKSPFTDTRFDALTSGLVEGRRARYHMVGALSTLENDYSQDSCRGWWCVVRSLALCC